jgi:hypothetical protein
MRSDRLPKQASINSLVKKETPEMTKRPHVRRTWHLLPVLFAVLLTALVAAAPASAEFGMKSFDVFFSTQDSTPAKPADDQSATQAGSHPFALTSMFTVNYTGDVPDGELRDLIIEQVAGFAGNAKAVPQCSTADFIARVPETTLTLCPEETAVGVSSANIGLPEFFFVNAPVYNLVPPPGAVARLGFVVLNVPITVDVGLKQAPEYNIVANARNFPQPITVFGGALQLWGVPADPAHDPVRGHCVGQGFAVSFGEVDFGAASTGSCPSKAIPAPFLTMPRSCTGPAKTSFKARSWEGSGEWIESSILTHDGPTTRKPRGFTGCGKLGFAPSITALPSTNSAEAGTGLEFSLDIKDEGLTNPEGLAQSDVKKAEVTLPEGVTINPSVGEGLEVCSPDDLARETISSAPGEGCPNGSKIGTVEVETPLIEDVIGGEVFLAQQDDPATTSPGAENPFDSLIAFYIVLKNPSLGILVKLPALVEPDPRTGQLVVTVDDAPQLPFSSFGLNFREGQRAPLVSPPACGTYTTKAVLTPWANPSDPVTTTSNFEITEGVNSGPCPPGGIPPFKPAFEAGAINNNAGSFSPFNMRLIRNDGEQDMTKFSSILPPGQVGSLAGIDKCPDIAVAIAKSKTGREELASPSCPANSQIGRTLAGAGVGAALTYVPGQIYLGGPYKGAPLSVISITPAVAGPFDAGTVAVRLGLTLNPKTAEVEVDGAASDPIPHILKGIVLKMRDLRVYVDRPNFIINPTSCDPSSAKATLFGSFLDVFNPADDVPVDLATRYQAANCLNLGFKPKLNLNLKGGTKRGGHPGLKAVYKPRKGDANVEGLVVRLPRSAFLDQAHIRTICTRVQFASDSCPPAAQYGYIKAFTPLLEEPLQGPVWLRSSNNKLPDMVFDLHGLVDVEVATRIDSIKGGIRATVEDAPDAPLSKVELRMQGGKKGLIVNSRNLCGTTARANVQFSGHNGKQSKANPVMRADGCGGKRKAKR